MISIIAVVAKNEVTGRSEKCPCISDYLNFFANFTKEHSVIIGRKTYESIVDKLGKPLPNRKSYVITRQASYKAPGCAVISSIDDAIWSFSSANEEVFVIGGREIFDHFLPVADKLYIAEINACCDGDVMFPKYDFTRWKMLKKEHHPKDELLAEAFDLVELARK